jgi:pimeloyl-ACP methyl ester carboxylesterase
MAARKRRVTRPSGPAVAGAAAGVAAGAAVAGAVAAQRALAARKALDPLDPQEGYEHTPDEHLTVIASDGVALYAEIDHPAAGAGTEQATVVLSHGYTLNLKAWVLQRRALVAAGYRVVAWDQRSHGRSAEADPDTCTIDQLGVDLRSVIEATCPQGPVVLVGHSMGGMTTMSYASQFPAELRERVVAVGLVATAAVGAGLTDLGMGRFVGRTIGWGGPLLLLRMARHQGFLNTLRPYGRAAEDALVMRISFDSPVSERLVRFVADIIFATPFSVMAAFLPSLGSFDVRRGLEAMRGIEVLVINGTGDLLTPPSYSREIVKLVPGAEHLVVRNSGHLIMLEHPALVSEQIVMLIERALKARADHVAVQTKPRVVRTITDIAKMRRVDRIRARAGRS